MEVGGLPPYLCILLQHQDFVILVAFIAGNDYLFSCFQAFCYFIILRVLTADLDLTAIGFLAIFVEYEDPAAAGALEECSAWDDDTLCRLSQFQIDIISLTATDIVRAFACKHQVRTEFTVATSGYTLRTASAKLGSLTVEVASSPG